MLSSSLQSSVLITGLALLLRASYAQDLPPELSGEISFTSATNLYFDYPGAQVTQPGQQIPIADTVSMPNVSTSSHLTTGTYLFIMVDPDYNTTVPTNVVLHTIYGNLTSSADLSTFSDPSFAPSYPLIPSSPPLAPYVNPQPPSSGPPHHYTGLLFPQPADFVVPAEFTSFLPLNLSNLLTRVNFPLLDFISASGLGNSLEAAVYWEVILANSTTTTTASSTATSTAIVSTGTTTSNATITTASSPPIATGAASSSITKSFTCGLLMVAAAAAYLL